MNDKIRILVVDDSAFMRSAIKNMLMSDPGFEVVATARDGEEAIAKVKAYQPDIVTMDIEMPRMDGLEATKRIMQENPLPILIVSSLTEPSAQVTLDAMDAGAVDFICKDLGTRSLNIINIQQDLISRIKSIVNRKIDFKKLARNLKQTERAASLTHLATQTTGNVLCVAIGISTGGPKALQEVIPFLPKDLPVGIVIVQHMPEAFTKGFAERLNAISQLDVKEAEDGDIMKPGLVIVAKGGKHLRLHRKTLDVIVELSDIPHDSLHKPSVNEMMLSAVKVYGGRMLGVIMTGMGNDGLLGMRALKTAGGKTIAQNEESCIVYGMPKAVVDEKLADKIVPLSNIANEIVNMV